jgi:transcriptional regulator with XRE-family HTH domain
MGDHCNHSCLQNANHSCKYLCNSNYMGTPLPQRIKTIREKAGDSVAQAGARIGISRQAYEKWENSATQNMKLKNLLKFCNSYGIGVAELLLDESQGLLYMTQHKATAIIASDSLQQESELVQGFRLASPELRQIMLDLAHRAKCDSFCTRCMS